MNTLESLRKSKKLLQKDVAAYLGVDRTTYVKYELGQSEPSIGTLIKLSNFFNVSIGALVGHISNEQVDAILLQRPELQDLADQIRKLDKEQTLKAIDYIQLLLLQQEQEK